jgi:hypothetical protein
MESPSNPPAAIANIDDLLAEMRPMLHRILRANDRLGD